MRHEAWRATALIALLVASVAASSLVAGPVAAEDLEAGPACVGVTSDARCPGLAASLAGDARGRQAAATLTGSATCSGLTCLAASGTGDAAGFVAASPTGSAQGRCVSATATGPTHRTPHPPIRITEEHGPQGFTWTNPTAGETEPRPGSGVVAGSGTAEDPYVIEGWCIVPPPVGDGILLEETDAHVVVRDNRIVGWNHAGFSGTRALDIGVRLIETSNVRIANNTVSHAALNGIDLVDSHGITIENNTLIDTYETGIRLFGTTHVEMRDNTVDRSDPDIGVGIGILHSDQVNVTGNDLLDHGWVGVGADKSTGLDITGNTITGTDERGLYVSRLTDFRFASNNLSDNGGFGGLILDITNLTIVNNSVTGGIFGALQVEEIDGARIAGNTFSHANDGLAIARSANLTVVDNVMAENRDGGFFVIDSSGVEVHRNNIWGNEDEGIAVIGGSGPVNATDNWWGASSGPSGGVVDACGGRVADGSGELLETEEGGTVCFDPWLDAPNSDAGAD